MLNSLLLTFQDIYNFFSFLFLFILSFIFYITKLSPKTKIFIYQSLFFIICFSFIGWSFLLAIWQYQIWKNHPFSKHLLPPYTNIDYFLGYAYFNFFRDLIYRIISSLAIYLFLFCLSKFIKRNPFYDEEKILVPFLSLLFIFPLNFIFVLLGFFMLLLIIIANFLKNLLVIGNYKNEIMFFSFKDYWILNAWLLFIFQYFLLLKK